MFTNEHPMDLNSFITGFDLAERKKLMFREALKN
jgi:hypothetical protein